MIKSIKEIIIALATITGTITTYHFLTISTNTLAFLFMYLPYLLRPPFVMLSPGILAAIIYGRFYPNTAKMIMIAIITSIAWIFWFSAIYPALMLD
ncbi:hypothetical protein [Methanolobus chelungpuianus]|uniref:Uncharacterized protein n=1 Tax=Methanolobus chelungpuianus TaxID=502115 RepID=A0AAE3HB58_9EURY|nr:hypothetical protein [Methanolobus chelungpuianus]MCQ6963467.1 hypothetical protein [Methanolobus chelungpuianus]